LIIIAKERIGMEDEMNEIVLTVNCNKMANAKVQRLKFDETLKRNGWYLMKHERATKEGSLTSTITIWTQSFLREKPQPKIGKQIKNLLKRAAEWAEIKDYAADYVLEEKKYSI
jgi:hypothetical protein